MRQSEKINRLKEEVEQLKNEKRTIPTTINGVILSVIFFGISIGNFFLIVYSWGFLEINDLFQKSQAYVGKLLIIFPIIGEYIFISLFVVCVLSIFKGGFKNIKSIEEDYSLLNNLLGHLAHGLSLGIVFCFVFGIFGGILGHLLVGILVGLITGLILGLSFCLIHGIKEGISDEFW